MGDLTLSKLQKKHYKEISELFGENDTITIAEKDFIRLFETLDILATLGYIRRIYIDNAIMFQKVGDFSDFDEWHKDREREERKMSAREWQIGIIGALIGLIPFITTTVIPWILSLF